MEKEQEENMVSVNGIIEQVAEFYGIDTEDILYGGRKQEICDARHVAMYLCHRMLGISNVGIGAEFGKNRTLATYAIGKVSDWVADPRFNRKAAECVRTIILNNEKR